MQHVLAKTESLYIHDMGKAFRVTAIFSDTDEANRYMEEHTGQSVIACLGPFILLADKHDDGQRLLTEKRR